MSLHPLFLRLMVLAGLASSLRADPLSISRQVDFFTETTSRNLAGMATRSDGRLLNAGFVSKLPLDLDADLLWTVSSHESDVYVGTGPVGKIFSIAAIKTASPTVKLFAKVPDSHVLALATLPDGGLLTGTSPKGTLSLLRAGEIVSSTSLPVGSVLDILVYHSAETKKLEALVATGAPACIYKIDLSKFEQAHAQVNSAKSASDLAALGITPWATVRDDNIRTLLRLADGRVIAGSAPNGNVYQFAADGGAPLILEENENSEVTDLLAWDQGFFAAITQTAQPRDARLKRAAESAASLPLQDEGSADKKPEPAAKPSAPPATVEKFKGRSKLVWFPLAGFPETVTTRDNTAFYQLGRHNDNVIITGGEEGEILGYAPARKRNLTFAGAVAAQVNGCIALPGADAAFLLVGNNPASLELFDFRKSGTRSARTDTIDLEVPSQIGALRLDRTTAESAADLLIELRTNYGRNELEGWSDWKSAKFADGAWKVDGMRGRYLQLRLTTTATTFETAAGTLFTLPQNRRPQLQSFATLAQNLALIPAASPVERSSSTLGQLLQRGTSPSHNNPVLSSEMISQPGTQVVYWEVTDADNDHLLSTFSIRKAGNDQWIDMAVDSTASYAQFEVSHLPEGVYHTRLVVTEAAPRTAADRLQETFETDDLIIDRTPPEILAANLVRVGSNLLLEVQAKDSFSLLRGVEVNLNAGVTLNVENPVDGILDGQEETFTWELNAAQLGASNSVEIVVLDALGNSAARRLPLPKLP